MKLKYLQRPYAKWTERIPASKEYPRSWVILLDMQIELSDGYILKVKKGTVWDGASFPKWIWWLFSPIDEAAIGDLIHDVLWTDKKNQFRYFKYNIYKARKFADDERLKWRTALARTKMIKNYSSHLFLRVFGGLFYSNQIEIPK